MSFFEWLTIIYITAGMFGIGKWVQNQEEKNPNWDKGSSTYIQLGSFIIYIIILYNIGF